MEKSKCKEVNLQSLETTELLNKMELREDNCRGIKDVCVVGRPHVGRGYQTHTFYILYFKIFTVIFISRLELQVVYKPSVCI